MGESQLEQVESDELFYVPRAAFERLLESDLDALRRAAVFAAYTRINVLYTIARAWSGHPGTCLSATDIMTWLFLQKMQGLDQGEDRCDLFLSSKGHDAPALYAVLAGLGLLDFELLHALRRVDGLAGHPHVETPFIQANTGSQASGWLRPTRQSASASRV